MQVTDIFLGLGQDRLVQLLRSVSIGRLKTYKLYDRMKTRLHLNKMNSEVLRNAAPRIWARIEERDEEFTAELAQAILISHFDIIKAVLDHLGVPHEEGFFSKDTDVAALLKLAARHGFLRDALLIWTARAFGARVVILDGAVIGSDGFGFVTMPDKTHVKIPQHGDVVIEDDVEIGASTTIDRPAVGETRIKSGTKIDNLVQIAHGVTIGHRVRFAAQVGIAGSTIVEDDVVLAGQVGVAGHLTIGAGAIASAQTGIPNNVDAGMFVSGYPAIANRDWLKSSAVYRKLPALKKRVSELEHRLAELEARLGVAAPAAEEPADE